MKFDKENLIYVLGIVLIIIYMSTRPMPQQEQQPITDTTQPVKVDTAVAKEVKPQNTPELKPATVAKKVEEKLSNYTGNIELVELKSDELTLIIDSGKGAITSIKLNKQKVNKKSDKLIELLADKSESLALTLDNWQLATKPIVKKTTNSLNLTRTLLQGNNKIEVNQVWTISENKIIDYKVALKNISNDPIVFNSFGIKIGQIYPLAKMADMNIRIRETHIDYVTTDEDFVDNKIDINPEDFPQGTTEAVNLFAVSNKFFAMLIQTDNAFGSGIKFTNTQKISDSNENEVIAFGANAYYKEFTLSPNSTKEFSYKAYSGIKNKAIFEELNDEAGRVMHLSSFAPLAFLSSKLLDALEFFKNIFGSYGISIILLTIIVRLIFWPITAKGTESMKKMQVIQPMIKEIQEKYKDDRQMASMKVMELYKEHKVNPVGGCIPMLIQIPIFMSFYWGIDGAANLRHQSFMWASDLTQPDLVAHILGLPIHPLVLLMTGLMVLQQKLTPTTGDPAQKNMMMVMPLVLLFVMYGMPAGLTLYWTTSNIMSIIQLVTTQKLKQTN